MEERAVLNIQNPTCRMPDHSFMPFERLEVSSLEGEVEGYTT